MRRWAFGLLAAGMAGAGLLIDGSHADDEGTPQPLPPAQAVPSPDRNVIPVRVPYHVRSLTSGETQAEGPNGTTSTVEFPVTRQRTEHPEIAMAAPTPEEESKLRQERKELFERKVESLSPEELVETLHEERDAARERSADAKLKQIIEQLTTLQKEFAGTAAAERASAMEGASKAREERQPTPREYGGANPFSPSPVPRRGI